MPVAEGLAAASFHVLVPLGVLEPWISMDFPSKMIQMSQNQEVRMTFWPFSAPQVPDFHSAPAQLRPGRLTGEALRELFPTLCARNHMIPSRYKSVVRRLESSQPWLLSSLLDPFAMSFTSIA